MADQTPEAPKMTTPPGVPGSSRRAQEPAADAPPVLVFRSASGRTEVARLSPDGTLSVHVLRGRDFLPPSDVEDLRRALAERVDQADALAQARAEVEQVRHLQQLLAAARRDLQRVSAERDRGAGELEALRRGDQDGATGWLVGELHRLADGMEARDLPLQHGTTPVGGAVDTALAALDSERRQHAVTDAALRRHLQALSAERAQWSAEVANLRQLIAGRADDEVVRVAEICTALRVGPGLVDEQAPAARSANCRCPIEPAQATTPPAPVVFLLQPYDTRVHTACRLYAGPDRDHLALCGELRLRHAEYAALQDALTPARTPAAAATTLEMRTLHLATTLTPALRQLQLPADVLASLEHLNTLLAEVNRRAQAAGRADMASWLDRAAELGYTVPNDVVYPRPGIINEADRTALLNEAVNRRAGAPDEAERQAIYAASRASGLSPAEAAEDAWPADGGVPWQQRPGYEPRPVPTVDQHNPAEADHG